MNDIESVYARSQFSTHGGRVIDAPADRARKIPNADAVAVDGNPNRHIGDTRTVDIGGEDLDRMPAARGRTRQFMDRADWSAVSLGREIAGHHMEDFHHNSTTS
jgi:hypothetical protein